jgi:ABC-type Fe3+-hydroxamate transport system substrate-binding protein
MKDQLNRTIPLHSLPKRIVSLVPSQTELLCDLGLEPFIVGVTKFCVHPHTIRTKAAVVGGTKTVNYKTITALKPDIILCNQEENTLEMVRELEKIAPVHISVIYTINDCLKLIEMYGRLFSVETKADNIITELKEKQTDFLKFIKGQEKQSVVYFIWKQPWMVAASRTFIDALLQLNNLENCYKNLERYPEIELTEGGNGRVDLVLLSSEPYPFREKHIQALRSFYPKARIRLVDGEMFSWYGYRLVKAFDYFKMLHQNDWNQNF